MPQSMPAETITDSYRFRLVRKIAEGGMGTIYEAVQYGLEGFEKIVAFKTIVEDLTTDADFVQMFIGEARLVADLIHQNIVQVYQLGKIADSYYIAMEYVHGVDLQEFLDRHFELGRRVPVDLAAFIISRCCLGLDYAHNKTDATGQPLGVVHRDICPKNVMIDTQGVVKITDFGIAKARQLMRDREGEVLIGKVEYMSPEQARRGQTDRRSDVFSLGIVMYEMLAGQHLFNDEDTRVTVTNILKKPIPPVTAYNADVPNALNDILMKALERDREHRFQTANAFGYALEHWMYHDRFGPTYQRLETYLKQIFPRFADPTNSRSVPRPSYHSDGSSDPFRGSA